MPAIKIPANINNGFANSGTYNPIYSVSFNVSGTAAAITALTLYTLPCAATLVGVGMALQAPGTTITLALNKVPVGTQTPVAVYSTVPIITSSATGNPVGLGTITKEGVTTTWATGSGTGMTAPVLKVDGTCSGVAGDQFALTTSGTFTSSNNLSVTLYFRDDSGSI